jgi:hypothetical protein
VRAHTLSQTADVEIVIRVEDHDAHLEQRDRTVESFATPDLLAAAARLSRPWSHSRGTGPAASTRPYDDAPASTNCITAFRKLPTPELKTRSRRSS